MTSASREPDSGAALFASSISAFRSMRYWSSGAMVGYGDLASCACARHAPPNTTSIAKLLVAIVQRVFRFIDLPPRLRARVVSSIKKTGPAVLKSERLRQDGGTGRVIHQDGLFHASAKGSQRSRLTVHCCGIHEKVKDRRKCPAETYDAEV